MCVYTKFHARFCDIIQIEVFIWKLKSIISSRTRRNDDIDETAAHIVLFDGSHPVGVCRIFTDHGSGRVMIGRVAVRKAFRGRGLGADIIKAAEKYAAESGINKIWIHSQEQAAGFYSALGYKDIGIHDVEEGCRIY